jgi:hypothetical protein
MRKGGTMCKEFKSTLFGKVSFQDRSSKKYCCYPLILIILSIICSSLRAESLYVADHGSLVHSFDVFNGLIKYRKSLALTNPNGIDLAIDDEHGILFRTIEFSNTIELIDAKSLTFIKQISINEAFIDTAIVYDAANSRLLCTQRDSNNLNIINWNPSELRLTHQCTITLSHIQNACDLAIHDNVLYVSEFCYDCEPPRFSNDVLAYDITNNFSFIGKISMNDPVVSIDYNAADDSIYGGAFHNHPVSYTHLTLPTTPYV